MFDEPARVILPHPVSNRARGCDCTAVTHSCTCKLLWSLAGLVGCYKFSYTAALCSNMSTACLEIKDTFCNIWQHCLQKPLPHHQSILLLQDTRRLQGMSLTPGPPTSAPDSPRACYTRRSKAALGCHQCQHPQESSCCSTSPFKQSAARCAGQSSHSQHLRHETAQQHASCLCGYHMVRRSTPEGLDTVAAAHINPAVRQSSQYQQQQSSVSGCRLSLVSCCPPHIATRVDCGRACA
jgi:hypothetical protein